MPAAQIALHRAVTSTLKKDKDITALLANDATIEVADSTATPWRSATFDGMRHRFIVKSVLNSVCYDTAKALSDRIVAQLHNADIDLNGHVLIDLSLYCAQTRCVDGRIECDIEFDAVTISD